MKIIDLLNKIANGEEVPKKVKYKTHYWEYKEERKDYKDKEDDYVFSCSKYDIPEMLDNEIEIIEDTPKEEKKIPKKIEQNNFEWEYVYSKKSNEEIINNLNILRFKYNEIIDYLKSKGE